MGDTNPSDTTAILEILHYVMDCVEQEVTQRVVILLLFFLLLKQALLSVLKENVYVNI